MSIAPIVRTVTVRQPPDRAFDLFTARIGDSWPRQQSLGPGELASVSLEPRVGGRWREHKVDGSEATFGDVLAWEPPHRLLLAWRIDAAFQYDPALTTEVEVRFDAIDEGTRVTLEHRNLERFGSDAPRIAELLGGGWPTTLAHFADFTATTA
ncbi:MAG: SRPBCC family protein [Sphingomonadaceae bacterium]|nr:SRPBCC family protein [Sphingomonadaceae bacterium]